MSERTINVMYLASPQRRRESFKRGGSGELVQQYVVKEGTAAWDAAVDLVEFNQAGEAEVCCGFKVDAGGDVHGGLVAIAGKIREQRQLTEIGEDVFEILEAEARRRREVSEVQRRLEEARVAADEERRRVAEERRVAAQVERMKEYGEIEGEYWSEINAIAGLLKQLDGHFDAPQRMPSKRQPTSEDVGQAMLILKSARKERERLEMLAWVERFGSARLKRCVEEGISCAVIYADELLARDRPGWVWASDLPGKSMEPRNPSASAFELLDEARRVDPGAALVYHEVPANVCGVREGRRGRGEPKRKLWSGVLCVSQLLGREIVYGHRKDIDALRALMGR
ncbi:MAG: hypothetical protein KKH12_16185 [Gammaproteobacteria bacterium]|nr:hypothetical protein [Gammaproteobacteria bacterium]